MSIQISDSNLKIIFKNIQKHSPYPSKVSIVAATKGFDHQAILSAVSKNINCVGENRVQEFFNKQQKTTHVNFESHLIGHLQSNKIKKATEIFDVIQTVDSIKLAEKLNKQLFTLNKRKRIYIQINIGNDPNKFGFKPQDLLQKIEKIEKMKHLKIEGIMTILPYLAKPANTESLFKKTRHIFQETQQKISPTCKQISMGMSRDYIYALKQGATHIRIGTLLYGSRPTNVY